MPGTYPRSTNPYFPFDRIDQVEEQLNLFHDLTGSSALDCWALSTVFSSLSEAKTVADILNSRLGPFSGGRYVVVPANESQVWCRDTTIEDITKYISSKNTAWSVLETGVRYIIVWEPHTVVLKTTSDYLASFNKVPYLDPCKKILWPEHYHCQSYATPTALEDSLTYSTALHPIEYAPVLKLPILDRCRGCGEPLAFCRCPDL